jgi:hypothetical protein
LSNIKVGTVDKSLFAIPDGFIEMPGPSEEPIKVPDWAAEISSAQVITPPFEQTMSAGEMVRIKVMPGKSIWVKAADQGEGEISVKAVPFKNGIPVKEISTYNNFGQKGTVCQRREETEFEADEVIIRVFEGSLKVVGKYFPMQESLAVAGESFAYKIISGENIVARFVNTAETESHLVFSFSGEGRELSEEAIGPETFRIITLKAGKTLKRTLNPSGDMMIMRVKQGSILIKIGQYDSFEW